MIVGGKFQGAKKRLDDLWKNLLAVQNFLIADAFGPGTGLLDDVAAIRHELPGAERVLEL